MKKKLINVIISIAFFLACEQKKIDNPINIGFTIDNSGVTSQNDTRCIENGVYIYRSSYVDQPYGFELPDKSWIILYTKSKFYEGGLDETIGVGKSYDQGKSWTTLSDLDTAHASYVVPYLTRKGRIYAFYTFNTNRVIKILNGVAKSHLVGDMVYKFSDDFGVTWSDKINIEIPKTSIDFSNEYGGKYINWWSICKPIRANNQLYFAFSKKKWDVGEGFIINCPNIEVEIDVNKLKWNFYPGGVIGIKSDLLGDVQEEHNIVQLSEDNFACVYRTTKGFPAICYSKDGCKTWSKPKVMTYVNGDTIRNPRACPRLIKCVNGNYLFWFHNNSFMWGHRNPGWVSGGIEKNGEIIWSQPEVLLYSKSELESLLMSYPDMIEDGTNYYITETQKKDARINQIKVELLNNLWEQFDNSTLTTKNLILNINKEYLDTLTSSRINLKNNIVWNGMTLQIAINKQHINSYSGEILSIISNQTNSKVISLFKANNRYKFLLFDKKNTVIAEIETNNEQIQKGNNDIISFSVDPNIGLFQPMINGIIFKGNNQNKQGWIRIIKAWNFDYSFGDIFLSNSTKYLFDLKVYKTYLTTSQQVSNFRFISK